MLFGLPHLAKCKYRSRSDIMIELVIEHLSKISAAERRLFRTPSSPTIQDPVLHHHYKISLRSIHSLPCSVHFYLFNCMLSTRFQQHYYIIGFNPFKTCNLFGKTLKKSQIILPITIGALEPLPLHKLIIVKTLLNIRPMFPYFIWSI